MTSAPLADFSDRPEVLVVANPISGSGRAKRAAEALTAELQRLGTEASLAFTEGPGDAARIVREVSSRVGRVVSVGGDGTLNDVVRGLQDLSIPVGMLPTGTANILAKELSLPRDPEACAAAVAAGATVPFDLPAANGRRFLLVAGIGFDAAATKAIGASRSGTIRMWHYIAPISRLLFSYTHPRLRVTLHDPRGESGEAEVHENLISVVVANVRCYGGPFELASYAHRASGELDVLMMRGTFAPISLGLFMLAGFFRMAPLAPGVTYRKATSLTVESQNETPVQLDGDYTGETPVEFRLGTQSVRILAPWGAR